MNSEFLFPVFKGFVSSEDEEIESKDKRIDWKYKPTHAKSEDSFHKSRNAASQQFFNQSDLNDLVGDFNLS